MASFGIHMFIGSTFFRADRLGKISDMDNMIGEYGIQSYSNVYQESPANHVGYGATNPRRSKKSARNRKTKGSSRIPQERDNLAKESNLPLKRSPQERIKSK